MSYSSRRNLRAADGMSGHHKSDGCKDCEAIYTKHGVDAYVLAERTRIIAIIREHCKTCNHEGKAFDRESDSWWDCYACGDLVRKIEGGAG